MTGNRSWSGARMARAGIIAILTLGLSAIILPRAVPEAVAQGTAQPRPPQGPTGDVRALLAQYGNFVQHQKYGEVWVPTATPPGWHPYPPCHWVYTKHLGWYFDDKTPWGQIVHHYGRWSNDPQMGWIWVPDTEFSPGWVVWRTSSQWIGWAPTPPDTDIQLVSSDQFNNGSQWIFIDVSKMRSGCSDSAVVPAGQFPVVIGQTKYVTEIEYVDGIAVFVLPLYVIGPIVDIGFNFNPWPAWFFVQIILDWNWIWTNTNIVINVNNLCGPGGGVPVSDIRLKRDIALLERLPNGLGLYRYRYTWSNQVYVGVMAQEVAEIVPDAVVHGPDGFLRVNYERLGMRLLTWDEWVATPHREAASASATAAPLAMRPMSPDQLSAE
jgi:Chaperone of endosialidase